MVRGEAQLQPMEEIRGEKKKSERVWKREYGIYVKKEEQLKT